MLRSEDASKWESYNLLMVNGTWELTNLPNDRKSVICKWVFRTKKYTLDEIIIYKAWLVAKGYFQVDGVDFNEILSHMAKFITIRCILTLGMTMDWKVHQMDIKTSFLIEYWRWTFT